MSSRLLEGVFARQVATASAKRGLMDPLYLELSDHYSRMFQKLYPVWVLLGPGLSDPGHVEPHSNIVWLDSDRLLGDRASIVANTLNPWAILVSVGVGLHEVFHAAHTKTWTVERNVELGESEDPDDRQLALDRRLLEEPRMEATGMRGHAITTPRGRFIRKALRAAVADIIGPGFCADLFATVSAGQPVTRDMCGEAMTYLHARTHCATIDPAVLAPLQPIWEQVLGAADVAALDDLYARLVWVPDGDDPALDAFAREYRAIIGPPPAPTPKAAGAADPDSAGAPARDGDPAQGDAEDGEGDAGEAPSVEEMRDAMRKALATGRSAELEQLDNDVSLQDLLAREASGAGDTGDLGKGGGTGAPTGRLPDRGVDRPPHPDEVAQARRYQTRLQRARSTGRVRIAKRLPGGRFNARQYVRAAAQRHSGARVTSHPWEIQKQVRTPLLEPHVLLVVDTSGSMSAYEYALGPIVWEITSGLGAFGGRTATVLFGNGCELLCDGSRPMARVPAIKTGGGTAFGGDAIVLGCDVLDMENTRRPRFAYVISDGGWWDSRAGVEKIRWLRSVGVPTIHISIGPLPPLSVEADRICVISDPATALDIVADDTVEALLTLGRAPQALAEAPGQPVVHA
ncbi:MAG TPA: hypothetical protein VGO80_06550 [Solirubrobacteraceae bacterium]|jgi:hypothetical protein|nr:hypothetical protein [Solirubrobacteraceae bacterium]